VKTLADSKPGGRRQATVKRVMAALRLHMSIEERHVSPLVAGEVGEEDAKEANIAHGLVRDDLTKTEEPSPNLASVPRLPWSPPASSTT
jgi:hypothetical protein